MTRGRPALPREARRSCSNEDPREDHQGQGQGHRRADREVLQQEQDAVRAARDARPAIVLTKTRPRPSRPRQALDSGAELRGGRRRSTRSTRPPRRRAASCRVAKGQQEKAFDEAIFGAKKGEHRRPGQDASSATTSSRSRRSRRRRSSRSTQAKATIKQQLRRRTSRRRWTKFVKDFRKNCKDKTDCRRATSSPTARTRRRRSRRRRRAGPATRRSRHRRSRRRRTTPQRPAPPAGCHGAPARDARTIAEALARLDELTRRLRRRVPVGPRAGRALDRPAHRRGGLRARRRGRSPATTPSCSTSSATSSSRSTSCRCCSRSAAPATWREVAEHVPPEADPPPPARLRRGRGRRRAGERAAQLGRDQARRGGPRAGDLRRGAREPAGAAVRAQGPAPRGLERLRLRRRARTTRSRPSSRSCAARGRRERSTRSATCCSRPSTSRASSRSTPSSRCARGRRFRGASSRRGLAAPTARVDELTPTPARLYAQARPTSRTDERRSNASTPARSSTRRGNPTVEVEVALRSGAAGRAAVPVGRLDGRVRGDRAARRRRRLGRQGRHAGGRATSTARSPTRSRGLDAADQAGARPRADRARRHAEQVAPRRQRDPRRLAGRRARAAAAEEGLPLWRYLGGEAAHVLPVPMMNVLNGGAHADNSVDFQEFMVVPVGAPTLRRGLRMGAEVFHALKKTLHDAGPGDRGRRRGRLRAGPRAPTRRRCRCSSRASRRPATRPASDVAIALDPATSEIFDGGAYDLEHEGRTLCAAELAAYWAELAGRYPIVSIEDGMDEEDWDGWKALTDAHRRHASSSSATTCSSPTPSACSAASTRGVANSILIKVNQIGTLTETLAAIAHGARGRLHRGHVAPLGRDRGHDDRRPRGGHRLRPDQDRRAVALGSRRQVQPAAAHRGGARRRRAAIPGRSVFRSLGWQEPWAGRTLRGACAARARPCARARPLAPLRRAPPEAAPALRARPLGSRRVAWCAGRAAGRRYAHTSALACILDLREARTARGRSELESTTRSCAPSRSAAHRTRRGREARQLGLADPASALRGQGTARN